MPKKRLGDTDIINKNNIERENNQMDKYSLYTQVTNNLVDEVCDLCLEPFTSKRQLKYHITTTHSGISTIDDLSIKKKSDNRFEGNKMINGTNIKHKNYEMAENCSKLLMKVEKTRPLQVSNSLAEEICDLCLEPFTSKRQLKNHITTSHNDNSTIDEFSIRAKNGYKVKTIRNAINTRSKIDDFNCYNNEPQIDTYNNLQVFRETSKEVLPKICMFICNLCQKSFATKKLIIYHFSKSHSTISNIKQKSQKGIQILDCWGKKFSGNDGSHTYKSKLKLHEGMYTVKHFYKCGVSEKLFAQNSHLKIHLSMHTGNKPYKCTVCNKTFSSKGILKTHNHLHIGMKPFECTTCNKTFSSNGNLKTHYRMHIGEKPYECAICEKSFAQKSHLKIHLSMHTVTNHINALCAINRLVVRLFSKHITACIPV
ncbi:zinc finger protein 665-like isoform X2 [Adelges cooleyi]|uniref:zinc finger protein 665-like isoform X2 n=1 Tax=Adelges cooleyi TaxID=133065 RepID=UPI00218018DA|nr:zinc finger protein 665-like isoform X2 [Adelges cooleyi]